MTKRELISITNHDTLQNVKEELDISSKEIQDIDEEDFTKVADIILVQPEAYTDSEKAEIVELWVELVVQECIDEDILLEQQYGYERNRSNWMLN